MKKETLRGVLLLFICSGFWVMTLAVAASLLGYGFAQGPQPPYAPPYSPQNTAPPFGFTPQPAVPPQFGTPLLNNATVPNQGVATYNMTTREVVIPFQADTTKWLAFSVVVDNNVQTLTVLDQVNQSLAVYHVFLNGPNMGRIEWQSTRNIAGDLKMFEYQAMKLTPTEVQAFLEQRE